MRRSRRPTRAISVLAFASALGALGNATSSCGARTPLHDLDGGVDAPECTVDKDCASTGDVCNPNACQGGTCVQVELSCDDGDPCTDDACGNPGGCTHMARTSDLDGDGHRAPLPGHKPGDAGSCGDDCNDASSAAFPGNAEICDGIDNDCNGIVDDNARFTPTGADAVLVSSADPPASPGGLAFANGSYLSAYTMQVGEKSEVYTSKLGRDGSKLTSEAKLTTQTADSYGGPVVWIGDRYGIAWDDRRDNDYEVYFNRLDETGKKLGPDLRITSASGFSINPTLAWTGSEFVIVWQDDRDGSFALRAQRVGLDGAPIGADAPIAGLSGDGDDESPIIAPALGGVGVTWSRGPIGGETVGFVSLDTNLKPLGNQEIVVSPNTARAVFPTIAWNQDAFVVAWYDPDPSSEKVWAAMVDAKGNITVPAHPVTQSPRHSRYPALLPLGDRVLVVWSDDKDSNTGYELYSVMLDKALKPIGAESRITTAQGDSVFPLAAFGPSGDVGVLFRDDRTGSPLTYFTSLACQAGN